MTQPSPIQFAGDEPEERSIEEQAFYIALRQTWGMVDPLRPPLPGTYYMGEYNGIIAALKTIRENFEHALATLKESP